MTSPPPKPLLFVIGKYFESIKFSKDKSIDFFAGKRPVSRRSLVEFETNVDLAEPRDGTDSKLSETHLNRNLNRRELEMRWERMPETCPPVDLQFG
jgi:hypothetical protein